MFQKSNIDEIVEPIKARVSGIDLRDAIFDALGVLVGCVACSSGPASVGFLEQAIRTRLAELRLEHGRGRSDAFSATKKRLGTSNARDNFLARETLRTAAFTLAAGPHGNVFDVCLGLVNHLAPLMQSSEDIAAAMRRIRAAENSFRPLSADGGVLIEKPASTTLH